MDMDFYGMLLKPNKNIALYFSVRLAMSYQSTRCHNSQLCNGDAVSLL